MATKLEIYNMAISAARGQGIKTLVQQSREREECDRWYDFVVEYVQELAFWPCCKTAAVLTGRTTINNRELAAYYDLPADYLRAWYTIPYQRFTIEGVGGVPKLFSDATPLTLVYSGLVAAEANWTPGMTNAIIYTLASKLSETLTGKHALTQRLARQSDQYVNQAASIVLNLGGKELPDTTAYGNETRDLQSG